MFYNSLIKFTLIGDLRDYCRNHGVHTTHTMTTAKVEIPIFSPVLSPRILDDPIWLVAKPQNGESVGTISDEQNTVV